MTCRVVLLCTGPVPPAKSRVHSAAAHRAAQFRRAAELVEGVDLTPLEIPGVAEADRALTSPVTLTAREVDEPVALRRRLDALECDALVGASTYASFLLARSGHPAPLWIDLHGDPMAEGQAAADTRGDDSPVETQAWLLNWCLRRGDRFSTVSAAQRHAVLGQLGLAGRLNRHTAREALVDVVRESVEALAEPSPVALRGPFTLLFSGSFNSWVDGDLLAAALERLLTREPELRFVATGGEIEGFLEAPWRRFRAGIEALPAAARERISLHGWVDSDRLAEIERSASCGVIPERRLVERELGSHNRSLGWLARGLPIVATEQSEIGRDLAEAGGLVPYRPGDVDSFVQAVLRLAHDRAGALQVGERGRRWLRRARSLETTTAPLAAWLQAPRLAADRAAGATTPIARRHAEILRDQLTLEERLAGAGGSSD